METPESQERATRYTFGRNSEVCLHIENDRFLVVERGGKTNSVDLHKLRHFYIASNGSKTELILVEQSGRKPVRVRALQHHAVAMQALARRLKALAPGADRTGLRHGAAMRRLGVSNRPVRWLLFAPLIAIAIGIIGGSEDLLAALDRGHATADMRTINADWSPDSRHVTIENVRLLDDVWVEEGKDDRFWVAVVAPEWKQGDPVFLFASATRLSEFEAIARSGVLRGVVFEDGDTALPDNDGALRDKYIVSENPITIETPPPSHSALWGRFLGPTGVMVLIALAIALFQYRQWDKANQFRTSAPA